MDIDIDLSKEYSIKFFKNATQASMIRDNQLVKHNVGVYFQNIPKDNITNLSAIPYKEAEQFGYLKIDLLHLSLLDSFSTKEEIKILLDKEPNWGLLQVPSVVKKLIHLNNYYELIIKVKPQTIEDISDILALIRPGKAFLVDDYLNNKEETRKILYTKPKDGSYYFKKSHSISYAFNVILNLHLIEQGKL